MKTYAVDVHWDVAKCYEIEANSKEEAEKKMWDIINRGDVNVWVDGYETTVQKNILLNLNRNRINL